MSQTQTPTAVVTRSPLSQKLFEDLQALPSRERLSADELEVIYALAYAHVTQEQYAQALPVFTLLVTYAPTVKHYLSGLALCLQMCERYEDAIGTYSLLGMLNPESPEPALQVAECQLMLGRTADAAEELDRVVRAIAEAGGRHDALKPRTVMLQSLVGSRAH